MTPSTGERQPTGLVSSHLGALRELLADGASKECSTAISQGAGAPLFDGTISYPSIHCPGLPDRIGKCRIRAYESDGRSVVVCTEMGDNPGTCVTKAAETIATLVWEALGKPDRFEWIEHYEDRFFIDGVPKRPEEFSCVTFEWQGCELVNPDWRPLSKADAAHMCGTCF